MKLGIIEALNENLVRGSRQPIRAKLSARAALSDDVSLGDMSDTMEARHSLTVWFAQRVTKEQWDNEDFRIHLRKRAAGAITRHLFQTTEARLMDAMEALWEDGMSDHPAAKIVEEILRSVQGNPL
jgi:hypothetical protein